jgi:putative endonuclease
VICITLSRKAPRPTAPDIAHVPGLTHKNNATQKTMKKGFVYILTNKNKTTLYVGVTSNLARRIHDHKQRIIPGFTKLYNLDRLVYYETHLIIQDAIYREKRIKKGTRRRKESLIAEMNPTWDDLSIS